jgi:SAM-dependent methyltransferase
MDLSKIQFEQLKGFIEKWMKDPRLELETTFTVSDDRDERGKPRVRGVVDPNTFRQIAQRLRTKGFAFIPQDDRLSILTPKHIRFSLEGMGDLQDYCRDDLLQGKPFTAMIKDRGVADADLDIDEYGIRFKVRREEEVGQADPQVVELIRTWSQQKKAFRLLRRWSFQGNGVRMDLSMVRQSPTIAGGEYQWSSTFQERNILNQVPRYEVEVELLHDTEYTDTPEKALKSLIAGCGEVLRAIQKNSLLIRKSVAEAVRREYLTITASKKFRGVGPMTLQVDNIRKVPIETIPNVRTGYNVTDKADGLRTMGFVNEQGDLYLVDQSLNIYRTGLHNKKCAKSIVDGEWVTLSKEGNAINHYLIFDIYHYIDGKKVSHLPFITFKEGVLDNEAESRFNMMTNWYKTWKDGVEPPAPTKVINLLVALKGFMFATAGNDSIFRQGCASILDSSRLYHTDGLILTSNTAPIPDGTGVRFPQQFKWKPAKDNTVDFLINYERNSEIPTLDKITTSIQADTNSSVQYKTMRLYVGSKKGRDNDNPRATILFQEPIVHNSEKEQYKPALFHPIEFPDTMANTCYVPIHMDHETGEEYAMTHDTQEPIPNRSVVEMRYDPSKEPGWRWIPSRIRHDKTERLLRAAAKGGAIKYSGVMNDEGVANDVWNSIHNPVTESMIRNGTEQATQEEIQNILQIRESGSEVGKKYYESKAPKENMILVKGLRDFHNQYIKNDILIKRALRGGNKTLVDLACGKGGDLFKWFQNRARAVVGIDTSGDGITNSEDGAYKRYVQDIKKFGIDRVPKIAFVIGNSSKNIVSGEAGATPEESNMLRSIFGKYKPDGPVPPYINNVMVSSFLAGADVAACMFALHYFFESKATLDGFLRNLSEIVKIGGYFIGCCFDGNKIFQLLHGVERGRSRSGEIEGVPLWTIKKDYDAVELLPDDSSLGLGIDVEFISIGSAQKEYLVPFDLLTKKMASIGFSLLNASELKEMNLKASTNTFDVSYQMADRENQHFNMLPPVQEYSFLNRWFIFKRHGDGVAPEIPVEEVIDVEEVSASSAATSAATTAMPSTKSVKNKPRVASKMVSQQEFDDVKEEPPVATASASASVAQGLHGSLPDADRTFEAAEIFRFGLDVPGSDVIGGKKDKYIGRWMSLAGRFPIPDAEDPTIVYPTTEHFLAGMKLKHASNKPNLAKDIMSTDGSIHRSFRLQRRDKGIEPESGEDFTLLKNEIAMVHKTISTKNSLRTYLITIREDKWNAIKNDILMEALRFRFTNDARFIKGVTTARDLGKYLLYTTGTELGGTRNPVSGKISGDNKVGRFIMELANFNFKHKL